MDLPLYPEFPGAEVEVTALKGADLTLTKPNGELQQKEFETVVLFSLDQQPLDLLRGQHLYLSDFGGKETVAINRVAEEKLFGNHFVQCGMESSADALNGLAGETFTVELGIEPLNVSRV